MDQGLRPLLARDRRGGGASLRGRCAAHETSDVRSLMASIVCDEHHHACYGQVGVLGAPVGPLTRAADGWEREYLGGGITVQGDGLTPSAVVRYDCLVEYVGLRNNEPNESALIGTGDGDEPYVVVAVTTLDPGYDGVDRLAAVTRIGPLSEVHDGDVVGGTASVWQGIVAGTGLQLAVAVFEHDSGDPAEVEEAIEKAIVEAAKEGAAVVGAAFGAGGEEAERIAGSKLVTFLAEAVSLTVVHVLDLGDDKVGEAFAEVPLSRIRELTTDEAFSASLETNAEGLRFNHRVECRGGEGEYSVYLRVRGRAIPPIPALPTAGPG